MATEFLGRAAKAGAEAADKKSELLAKLKKRFGTQAMREEPEFGGRSKTSGGPSVEELQDFREARKFQPELHQMIDEAADRTGYRDYRITPEKSVEGKAKGGKVSASSRADGCAKRGKTRGKMV